MEGTVARLHCRYRVLGEAAAAPALTRRLEGALRPRLAAALGRSLDRALDGDPTVYCLRRVRSSLALSIAADGDDDVLAEAWGERLAGSAIRTLAADPDDGANLVRFADRADYVARFVSDLVAGSAWERWYYLAFRPLAAKPRAEALVAVLLDHRDELPAILGRLEERGRLQALLAVLPARALDTLWLAGLAGRPGAGRLASGVGRRALFAAAVALVEALGLPPISPARAGELLRAYRAEDGDEDDWSQPQELALGVARAFAFLLERRAVERCELAAAADRVASAVAPVEWLDREALAAALERLALPPAALHSPPRAGPTPAQRQLFADLAEALRTVAGRLDRAVPDAPGNALAVAAALYRLGERWRGEAMAVKAIERLLRAWAAIAAAPRPDTVLEHLRRGDRAPAQAALGVAGEGHRRAVADLAGMGAPAVEALAALAGRREERVPAQRRPPAAQAAEAPPHRTAEPDGIETPAAGLFLLLRALSDLRLPSLFERAAYPPLGCPSHGTAGVLALGMRWAGDRFPGYSPHGEPAPLDRGLAVLAGLREPPERERLIASFAAAGGEDHDRFQRLLLAAAAGQRLGDGSTLRLFAPGGAALVAQIGSGEGNGDLWPLGRIAGEAAERRRIVAGWLAAWEETVGAPPAEATADAGLLDTLAEREGWPVWTVIEEPAVDEGALHPHAAARERLLAALASLDAGRLSPPGEAGEGADLTLALTATVVLRAWARWLRRFADSSVPFLLERLLRRSGRVRDTSDALEVALDGRPLDLVLEMAGYLATLESPWGRTVRFHRRSLG